jgi:hypothetical protein
MSDQRTQLLIESLVGKKLNESDKIVNDVLKGIQGNFSKDNASQMKGLQLLKGLATSDDPKSNEFMKKLDAATTKIAKEVLGGGGGEEKKEAPKKEEEKDE